VATKRRRPEVISAPEALSAVSTNMLRHPDIIMSLAVVGVLMIMLLPLPRFALDVLLAFNITLAIIVLLVGMQVRKPLEFSVFPSVLLMVTLFRLSLNIASTRLILLHGNEGPAAAGEVIRAFGNLSSAEVIPSDWSSSSFSSSLTLWW